jgi:nucleoside-diphosphate-sugar epimerase
MEQSQNVLVVGATGGTGRAAVHALLGRGHRVTAFSRHAESLEIDSDRVTLVNGDATNPEDVDRAVAGHDAVVVTLGITENPMRVRFFGAAKTATDVRSAGTRNVIAAMRKHGVRKLVVQSSYGVGDTKDKLRWIERLFFGLLLKPQIADTEVQEGIVRESGVDWVLARPVHLTDEDTDDMPFASSEGQVCEWKIARKGVAQFLAHAAQVPDFVHQSVALSGPGAAAA